MKKTKFIYQLGGKPEANIQTEIGENIFQNGNISPVAATKTHSQYPEQMATDTVDPNAFIGSAFPDMKIDKKWGGLFLLGQENPVYKEGQKPKPVRYITLADYMPKGKHTPAEIMDVIKSKIKLPMEDADPFSSKTKRANQDMRKYVISALAKLSEMQKAAITHNNQTAALPQAQKGFYGLLADPHQQNVPTLDPTAHNPYNILANTYPIQDPLKPLEPKLIAPITSDGTHRDINIPNIGISPNVTKPEASLDLTDIINLNKEYLTDLDKKEPTPSWVGQVPYHTLAAKSIIGNAGQGLQNANTPYYNVSPSITNTMFKKLDPSLLQNNAESRFANNVLAPSMAYADQSGLSVFQKANLAASKYGALNTQQNDIALKTAQTNLDIDHKQGAFQESLNRMNYNIGVKNIDDKNRKLAAITQFNLSIPEEYRKDRQYQGLYEDQMKNLKMRNKFQVLNNIAQLKYLSALTK